MLRHNNKGENMNEIKVFNAIATPAQIEKWSTRFGVSVRVVKRTNSGQFINNKSAKQLLKA